MNVALRVALLLAIAACSSSPTPPDASDVTVHDLLVDHPCDRAWVDSGPPPTYCEYACSVRPTAKPCVAGTPCLDQPACMKALDQFEEHDCSVTFLAVDSAGAHRGCCAVRMTPGGMEPAFYECP